MASLAFQPGAGDTGVGRELSVKGYVAIGMQVSGTFVGTVTWQGTVNGDDWVSLLSMNIATGAYGTTATAPGIWAVPTNGSIKVRANVTAHTSGIIKVMGNSMGAAEFLSTGGGAGGATVISDITGFDTVKGQKTEAASLPVVPPSDGEYNAAAVATGAVGDAAVVTDTTGTVSGKLRGIIKWIAERMPTSLGVKAMTASLPTVEASDSPFVVATGTTADAAVVTDTTGTVIGFLRGCVKFLFERMPASLGQKAMDASLSVAIANNQSSVDTDVVSVTLPTVLYDGNKTVTTATTAEALAGSQALLSGVRVKALSTNTGLVYVGDSSVAAANGYQLASGESVFLEIANLATVYVDAAENGEGVSFVGS